MKHDIFEFDLKNMGWKDIALRIMLLLFFIGMLCLDLFVWRP